jgi:hypothetical protein
MLLTEAEARQRWCPFSRVADRHGGVNRGLGIVEDNVLWPSQCVCIASACMAWRWKEYTSYVEPEPAPTHGYCGLASSRGGLPC